MAKPVPHNTEDPGLDLIKRYMLLTMAMMDAMNGERIDDFRDLLNEREETLLSLESQPFLSPQAIREFNIAVGIDEELQSTLRHLQGETVQELVNIYQGKKGQKAYKKNAKKGASGDGEVFLQAS
jgi:hypothetical protein